VKGSWISGQNFALDEFKLGALNKSYKTVPLAHALLFRNHQVDGQVGVRTARDRWHLLIYQGIFWLVPYEALCSVLDLDNQRE
jgi:hypothetical protein